MTQITYIKSALNHSSALTTPAVAITGFGLWKSIKKAFKKFAKPLAMVAGIALSIAVPFIAPAVAGAIFGGTALATGAIGAAIAGAGMGAAAGALTAYGTGQNVLMGAGLGLLGGGLGGGVAGYAQSGGAFLGSAAGAAPGGAVGTAIGGGQYVAPTSAAIGGAAPGTVAGQVGMPTGMVAAAGSTGAGMSTLTKGLLEATLKAAPSAIGTLVSSLAPSDVPQATKELQAEMDRLRNSDINAYNKASALYDQLYARYQQIDPVAAAQLAEGNVQMKIAGQTSEVGRGIPRGSASAEYFGDAERRRIAVTGAAEGTNAYTNAYYVADNAKTAALSGLTPPRYSSSTGGYLSNKLIAAENKQAGLASDVSGFLTPYALALAPKNTTITSEDEERRRAGLQDKSMVAV
jgi:hypothetical protein